MSWQPPSVSHVFSVPVFLRRVAAPVLLELALLLIHATTPYFTLYEICKAVTAGFSGLKHDGLLLGLEVAA